jgi:hypothetical protein
MASLTQPRQQDLIREIDELLKGVEPRLLKMMARRLCEHLDSVPDVLFEHTKNSIFTTISQGGADPALHILQLDSNLSWVWHILHHAEDKDPGTMNRTMDGVRQFLKDYDEQGLFGLLIDMARWKHEPGSQPDQWLDTHRDDLVKAVQQGPAIMRLGVLEALCEKAITQDAFDGIQRQLPRGWTIAERWMAVIKDFPTVALNYDWEYLLESIRRNEWDPLDVWDKEVQAFDAITRFRAQEAPQAKRRVRLNDRAESVISIIRDASLPLDLTPRVAKCVCHAAMTLEAEAFDRYTSRMRWLSFHYHPTPEALQANPGLVAAILHTHTTGQTVGGELWLQNYPTRGSMSTHDVEQIRQQHAQEIIACQISLHHILVHHEAALAQKWSRSRPGARRRWLENAWQASALDGDPYKATPINPLHGPDVTYALTTTLERPGPEPSPLGWRWPLINVEDLISGEKGLMMMMLHARGYNPPYMFTNVDLQSIQLGRAQRRVGEAYNLEWFMEMIGPPTVAGYGRLSYNWSLPELWRALAPTEGVLVLEAQSRLYRFLVRFCMMGLKITEEQVATLADLERPAAPDTPPAHIARGVADPIYYRLPGRLQDIIDIRELVRSQAFSARLHYRMLRGDPAYFARVYQSVVDHCPEQIEVFTDSQPPSLEPDPSLNTVPFFSKALGIVLYDAWYRIAMWDNLHSKFISLQDQIESQDEFLHCPRQGSDLPRLPEALSGAFLAVRDQLELVIKEQLQRLVDHLRASPPLRRAFCQHHQRAAVEPLTGDRVLYQRTGEADLGSNHAPDGCLPLWQHLIGMIPFLYGERHDTGTDRPLEVPVDIHQQVQFIHELQDRMAKDVRQTQGEVWISPYVQEALPELFLLADCWQQIHRYQPWAGDRLIHAFGRPLSADLIQGLPTPGGPYRFREFRGLIADAANTRTLRDLIKPFQPGTFAYPDLRRQKHTPANIAQCQATERALDELWERMISILWNTILTAPARLQLEIRSAAGTEVWKLSPVRAAVRFEVSNWRQSPKTSKEIAKLEQAEAAAQTETSPEAEPTQPLVEPIQQPAPKAPRGRKRGHTGPAEPSRKLVKPTPAVLAPEEIGNLIPISRGLMTVVDLLFFQPKTSPGSNKLNWEEFQAFMRQAGFTHTPTGKGSANTFHPPDTLGGRPITFHQPHPQKYWSLGKARHCGRRLTNHYNLTASRFQARD